jgi:hypothetical protein
MTQRGMKVVKHQTDLDCLVAFGLPFQEWFKRLVFREVECRRCVEFNFRWNRRSFSLERR